MKKLYLILFTISLASCNYFYNHIEIAGSIPKINIGDIIIKDEKGEVIFGAAIRLGKFYIPKQELKEAGYYSLYLSNSPKTYEIYLEPGKYFIKTSITKPNAYPSIVSSSKIQNELNAYHNLTDSIILSYEEEERKLIDQMNSPAAQLIPPQQYEKLIDYVKTAQIRNKEASIIAVNKYLKQFPDNEVIAHIVSNMNYEENPTEFFKLYQKFSKIAKRSKEGVEIGELLNALVRLRSGAMAPKLSGETPDNKTIEFKSLNKKVIIVDFWRASLMPSRRNHLGFINDLLPNFQDKGVGIVSVSLDTKSEWWTTAIKDDKMTWPQISDLKGFDSPNVTNWGIKIIPLYYILDGSGRIIQRDVQYQEIPVTVKSYLDNQNNFQHQPKPRLF